MTATINYPMEHLEIKYGNWIYTAVNNFGKPCSYSRRPAGGDGESELATPIEEHELPFLVWSRIQSKVEEGY